MCAKWTSLGQELKYDFYTPFIGSKPKELNGKGYDKSYSEREWEIAKDFKKSLDSGKGVIAMIMARTYQGGPNDNHCCVLLVRVVDGVRECKLFCNIIGVIH